MNKSTNEKKHNYFYKITNLLNGKFYYGIRSCEINPSADVRYMGSGISIKQAIKKYGIENFKKEIIADFKTRDEVGNYEKQIVTIDLVNDSNCYNLKEGGGSIGSCSLETREKMSKAKKGIPTGRKMTEENKNKLKLATTGIPRSVETKEKLSKSKKGKPWTIYQEPFRFRSEEYRDKISKTLTGRKLSTETKSKISAAGMNRYFSPETREKMSNSARNKSVKVGSIEFKSITKAAQYYNITHSKATNRFNSTKWKEWKRN